MKYLGFLALLMPLVCGAAEIYGDFPDVVHADQRYVFFSHGRIAEGQDERPVSPDFGVYDFPAIRQALFEGGDFNLIAYQRPKDADFNAYVGLLESWVRRLIDAGVKPSRITIVGFSRGSNLTAHASARLNATGINTVLIASCVNGDIEVDPPLVLGGRLLSIYETSDTVGTCATLAKRSTLKSFKEVSISTGRRHGAFFSPAPEWIRPLQAWIATAS